MPVEFECKDIGNPNCGFKAEANNPEELITKVNQHVRSAHGINPTDAQERVERAIKEKEAWRESGSSISETKATSVGASEPSPMETNPPVGATSQTQPGPGQPGWQTSRFGTEQGEQYRQTTGQEEDTANQYSGQTGTQSQMDTEDSNTVTSQRERNMPSTNATTTKSDQEENQE